METENVTTAQLKSQALIFEGYYLSEVQGELQQWLFNNPKYGVRQATMSHYATSEGLQYHVLTVVVRWLPLMNDNIQRINGRG